MVENRLPDARELSCQHLMAGSVEQTFKAHDRGLHRPDPQVQPAGVGVPVEENALSNPQSLRLKISQSSLSKASPAKRHFRSSIFTIKVPSIIVSHFTDFNRPRQSIILTYIHSHATYINSCHLHLHRVNITPMLHYTLITISKFSLIFPIIISFYMYSFKA